METTFLRNSDTELNGICFVQIFTQVHGYKWRRRVNHSCQQKFSNRVYGQVATGKNIKTNGRCFPGFGISLERAAIHCLALTEGPWDVRLLPTSLTLYMKIQYIFKCGWTFPYRKHFVWKVSGLIYLYIMHTTMNAWDWTIKPACA